MLNDKLADYIFFPLSHVLRESQKLPVRALELALECLSILLETGWRSQIPPNLAIQLLILLTFLADSKSSGQAALKSSEELQNIAFGCVDQLFRSLTTTPEGAEALLNTANIPALGKAVSVLLDGALDGASSEIQLSALAALRSFCSEIPDRDALATSFLPGLVSCISKVLTTSTKTRRSYKVVERAVDVLSQLLRRVLSDSQTENLPPEPTVPSDGTSRTKLNTSWLNATAAQVKPALANVIKVRHNARTEVRGALVRLCVVILQDCRKSMSESAPIMVGTLVCLSTADQQVGAEEALRGLMTTDTSLTDVLKSSLHQWVISLPRVMQAQDEEAKRKMINRISVTYRLLSEQRSDLTIVNRIMASSLRDSVTGDINNQNISSVTVEPGLLAVSTRAMIGTQQRQIAEFEPLLMTSKAQEDTVARLKGLIQQISTSEVSLLIARELVSFTQSSNGSQQLASFWLALNVIQSAFESSFSLGDLLDIGSSGSDVQTSLLDELYAFSLSILAESSSNSDLDWRLQALAIETIALQANQQKKDFRIELVEALYPVIHLVGSSPVALRNHAITCLNVIARACDYGHAADLIVSNVDYLVNAVALKLNTFDISPQAPQVLLMMIKLSGPSLLPYLDDLVSSIFAALECYHGYPMLVELLFAVLKGIAEEGVRTPQLAINGEAHSHRKPAVGPTSIRAVADMVEKLRVKREDVRRETLDNSKPARPSVPWPSSKGEQDNAYSSTNFEQAPLKPESSENEQQVAESDDVLPPAPQTYSLLLTISQLTQHYLTSSSAGLRSSLLSLLDTTLPALARHEDSFLPLINTLWPVLVRRLDDTEGYVVAKALDIIGVMCMHAGDFMTGRIEAVWQEIKKIYDQRAGTGAPDRAPNGQKAIDITNMVQGRGMSNNHNSIIQSASAVQERAVDRYVNAPTRIIWESFIRLLTIITEFVAIDEDTFDDIVEMLTPVLQRRADVKAALERRNPDAVWLALLNLERRPSESGILDSRDWATRRPVSNRNWASVDVVR